MPKGRAQKSGLGPSSCGFLSIWGSHCDRCGFERLLVLPVLVGKSEQTVVGLGGGESDAVSVVMHSTGLVLSTPLVPPHGSLARKSTAWPTEWSF